jgi:hypothetical protein
MDDMALETADEVLHRCRWAHIVEATCSCDCHRPGRKTCRKQPVMPLGFGPCCTRGDSARCELWRDHEGREHWGEDWWWHEDDETAFVWPERTRA